MPLADWEKRFASSLREMLKDQRGKAVAMLPVIPMWRDPTRLMSGAMRAPTVFLENRVIAQRHFNAVAFAAFLRRLDADGFLPPQKQRIRLEGFLSLDSRS